MSQKIKYISIKNYKGISDIQTDIPSRFVAIFGQNGAGKTSFLDAIKSAIKLEKGGNDKVKIGEESGEIVVEFEDFKIKRIVGSKGKLEVEHDGQLVSKPQAWLDNVFLGTIGDPHKFLSLHNREKVSYILSTHGKKLQFDELESERLKAYNERTDIHRSFLAKKEEIEKFGNIEFDPIAIGEKKKELKEKQEELEKAELANNDFNTLSSRIEQGKQLVKEKEDSVNKDVANIDLIKKQIENLQKQQKEVEATIENNKEELKKYMLGVHNLEEQAKTSTHIDTIDIRASISIINDDIQELVKNETRQEIVEQQKVARDELQEQWKQLDGSVLAIQEQQNKLIEDIKLSYELKIEDGVMFAKDDGVWIPVDELNKAKQLEIGVDVCLSGPNKVKIITIEDANALDPNTLERIKNKIEKEEAQCFIETVYNTGHESITISDGSLDSTS